MRSLYTAALGFALTCGTHASSLLLSSQIQYGTVIQGGVVPVYAFIYNSAPSGTPAVPYQVSGAYGVNYDNSLGTFTGSKAGDNAATFQTVPFSLNTSNVAPGQVAVLVTLTDQTDGVQKQQGGQFTVLDHADPALYLQGKIIPLSSKTIVVFTSNVFAQAPGSTEGPGGGFSPQLLGDPPPDPTAALDVDSVTSIGSPYITTTLGPLTNVPSNDDPSQGVPFQVNFQVPVIGEYSTTFLVHYSDEQDLPGADSPGSQLGSFTVDVNVTTDTAYWTVTTDTVAPEPGPLALLAVAAVILLACRRAVHSARKMIRPAAFVGSYFKVRSSLVCKV